jgi:cytochrome c oxidase subunit 4
MADMRTHTSQRIYVTVWYGLLLLLLLTLALAFLDLQPFNLIIALAIATAKMLLIVLYFMHVRYSSRLTWVFVAAGFVWLFIFLELTLSDYLTRGVR